MISGVRHDQELGCKAPDVVDRLEKRVDVHVVRASARERIVDVHPLGVRAATFLLRAGVV